MTRKAVIEFERVLIHDPDAHPNDYLFQDPDYEAEDQARLDAWKNDEWHFVGVIARATIKIPHGDLNPDCWIISTMDSPGLWATESDSGEEYLNEIYEEEKAELLRMLESLKDFEVQK